MSIFKKDFWHDDFAVGIVSLGWFMIAVWTFWEGDDSMYAFLQFFTPFWILTVAGFGLKRLVEIIKDLK